MTQANTKLPVQAEKAATTPAPRREWQPLESLQRAIDRVFADFDRNFFPTARDRWPKLESFAFNDAGVAADMVETGTGYELSVELPGMEAKDIEIGVANHTLTVSGEKTEEKKEDRKGYSFSERRFGSFCRSFAIPEGVDVDKIDAAFEKGVLKLTLPKTPAAQQPEKKIAVRNA
jgi:HSP20 family protein